MSVFTFGSSAKTLRNCELVRVLMKTLDGNLELHLFYEPLPVQPITPCINSFEHLSNLKFADSSDGNSALEVDLLIGSDHYWELATGKVSRGRDGPIAVETKLGWVLSGLAPSVESSCSFLTTHTLRVSSCEDSSLDATLHAFWELESLGISNSNVSVHQKFQENILFKDGHYEVCLPWKEPRPILPDNYELSKRRLHSLLRRLNQTPDILHEYDSVIQRQLELGIVQWVPVGMVGQVHYLPHHAVVKQKTPRCLSKVWWAITQRVSLHWTKLQPEDPGHSFAVPFLPSRTRRRHRKGLPYGLHVGRR